MNDPKGYRFAYERKPRYYFYLIKMRTAIYSLVKNSNTVNKLFTSIDKKHFLYANVNHR